MCVAHKYLSLAKTMRNEQTDTKKTVERKPIDENIYINRCRTFVKNVRDFSSSLNGSNEPHAGAFDC